MKKIHIECNPDEVLVKKIGFTKKQIVHHSGKGKLLNRIMKNSEMLAMVDEDDGSNMSSYEKNLKFVEEQFGVKVYHDKQQNKIIVLNVKLENWIIEACKLSNIKISSHNLPSNPDDLHGVINFRMKNYEDLLTHLLAQENPAILFLKNQLV